jgi:hypothetical protein
MLARELHFLHQPGMLEQETKLPYADNKEYPDCRPWLATMSLSLRTYEWDRQ